jgi:hypothetical protein
MEDDIKTDFDAYWHKDEWQAVIDGVKWEAFIA